MRKNFIKRIIIPFAVFSALLLMLDIKLLGIIFGMLTIDGFVGLLQSKHEVTFSDLYVTKTHRLSKWCIFQNLLYINPKYYDEMSDAEYNKIVIRCRQKRETGIFLYWFLYGFEFVLISFANLFKWKEANSKVSFNQEMDLNKDEIMTNYKWLDYVFFDNQNNTFLFA